MFSVGGIVVTWCNQLGECFWGDTAWTWWRGFPWWRILDWFPRLPQVLWHHRLLPHQHGRGPGGCVQWAMGGRLECGRRAERRLGKLCEESSVFHQTAVTQQVLYFARHVVQSRSLSERTLRACAARWSVWCRGGGPRAKWKASTKLDSGSTRLVSLHPLCSSCWTLLMM